MTRIRKFSPREEKNPVEVGTVFGRLTVTGPSLPTTEDRQYRYYECTCECGKVVFLRKDSLLGGDSKSCGCLAAEKAGDRVRTHGLSKHPLYSVWVGMHKRCYRSGRKDYKHYGGRGIKVEADWHSQEGLIQFIEDMYQSYEPGLELDRIDVDGNYCKKNCRWATRRQQVINRREMGYQFDTHYLEFNGLTLCMSEWADKIGVPATMISDRVTTLGWSVEKALTTKPKIKTSRIIIEGKIYEAKDIFVSYSNVYSVARKLGITGHDYLSILFKGIGKVEVYLCKQWVDYVLPQGLENLNIYEKKVPSLVENLPFKVGDKDD